jgi:hypothetical protein
LEGVLAAAGVNGKSTDLAYPLMQTR